MSFTTPTIDVYVPGTTLGIGNVNAGTINIGQTGTEVNIAGSMNVMNLVTSPSCTMTSLTTGNLTTGNLLIAPFSGDVSFNNFSAVNATFNSINSSNILIGPYPLNASIPLLNTDNIQAITPSGSVSLYSNSTSNINIGGTNSILNATGYFNSNNILSSGSVFIGTNGANITPIPPSFGAGVNIGWNPINNYGQTSFINYGYYGEGGFTFYTTNLFTSNSIPESSNYLFNILSGGSTLNTSLTINGSLNANKLQLNYTSLPSFTSNQVGYQLTHFLTSNSTLTSGTASNGILSLTLPIGVWNCQYSIRYTSSGTSTISSIYSGMVLTTVVTNFPNNVGLSYTRSSITVTSSAEYAVSGNGIISNATDSNTLKLNVNATYTGNTLSIQGAATPFTYLIATRIA
jgi:hypothetical protein